MEDRERVDFARPPGPNALFFFFFSPVFFLAPVLSSFALSASRGEYGPRSTFAHRKPSTTAEGPCLWRVWGKADINVAGTRIEPRDRGWFATCKEYPRSLFPCHPNRYPCHLINRNGEELKREKTILFLKSPKQSKKKSD